MVMYGRTKIEICQTNADLGRTAALAVADALRGAVRAKGKARAIFATGESQSSFLTALAKIPDIPWDRLDVADLDDFWCPGMPEELSCGGQIRRELFDHIRAASTFVVNARAADPWAEANRFEAYWRAAPVDVLTLGIGTSGHLGLSEPYVTDFSDRRMVRVVAVAEQSRRQLETDPNFRALPEIPAYGFTPTIPAMLGAVTVFTMVPLALKKPILTRFAAMETPDVSLPASILRKKEGMLYCDQDSCPDAWR